MLSAKTGNTFNDGKWKVDCHVHRAGDICGEETALLEGLEWRCGLAAQQAAVPAIKGLFGRPTIINNVETLAHLPSIIDNGRKPWFATMGCESSQGRGGQLRHQAHGRERHGNKPGVFEFDLGIKLKDLVEQYCGGMRGGKKYKAIPGGISMGILGPDQFEAELDLILAASATCWGWATACPTVFDEDTDMVAVARNIARFFKHESCGQRTPCREGSGWLYQLMGRIEQGDARTKDLDLRA